MDKPQPKRKTQRYALSLSFELDANSQEQARKYLEIALQQIHKRLRIRETGRTFSQLVSN